MSTTVEPPGIRSHYVTRDACEALHGEQRAANERTWEEIRALRRLVIMLLVGGQLLTAGLNVASVAYWLEQHTAQPHPATVQMLATARAEVREDLRDLRREVHDLAQAILSPPGRAPPQALSKKGEQP